MRRARIVLMVAIIVIGTSDMLRAQIAHSSLDGNCGCSSCAPAGAQGACCPPLLPSIAQGIHDVFSAVLPCPSCDARHEIYKAALRRNAFDKCCFPWLPLYSRRNCGVAAAGCPHCGPGQPMQPGMMEMQGVPEGTLMEPTPAAEEPPAPPTPSDVEPAKDASLKQWKGRSATTRPVAPRPARTVKQRDPVVRAAGNDPASAAPGPFTPGESRAIVPSSPIQKVQLLQPRTRTERSNPLRR